LLENKPYGSDSHRVLPRLSPRSTSASSSRLRMNARGTAPVVVLRCCTALGAVDHQEHRAVSPDVMPLIVVPALRGCSDLPAMSDPSRHEAGERISTLGCDRKPPHERAALKRKFLESVCFWGS
jgi:hypothetical protein